MKNVVIIGGMAAGCKAAARLKRLKPDFNVTIIEKGPVVSFGTCGMPFFAGGDIDTFLDLTKTPFGMYRDEIYFDKVKDVKVITNAEATKIDTQNQTVSVVNLINNKNLDFEYDYLLMATGASPLPPKFPCPESESITTFHNPLDAKNFRMRAQSGKVGSAAIIGAGFIGCELAEALTSMWGFETTLIELEDRLLPRSLDKDMSLFIEKHLASHDVNIKTSTMVKEITLNDGTPVVHLNDGSMLEADHVFLCMGVAPNVKLAYDSQIAINETGEILVDKHLKTSQHNVFAAGDCIETPSLITHKPAFFPLGSLSNRQGRVAAEVMAGMETTFRGATGVISMEVYGLTMAACGLNESEAEKLGIDYACCWGAWFDKPDYMPEVKSISAKVLYEKKTNKLLGMQLVGSKQVPRYIDAFSLLATHGGTIQDMIDYEHAYTPPHSGPINPLNNLGYMAMAQELGLEAISPIGAENFEGNIIDVRTADEIEKMPFSEKAIHIELTDFRNQIETLDKEVPLLVVCQKGPRSYEVANHCKNVGFKSVKYMGGGYHIHKTMLDIED
jgi:NADPH-dependent 2,4-dienoyl-CoA reductase/sulfur reductase-like enzyme/rhodanese-related sulfurtransferase